MTANVPYWEIHGGVYFMKFGTLAGCDGRRFAITQARAAHAACVARGVEGDWRSSTRTCH